VPIVTKNFGFPYIVFNTKEGVLANAAAAPRGADRVVPGRADGRRLRRHPLLRGRTQLLPQGHAVLSTAGDALYNQRNARPRRTQAAKAGYNGEPIRIMASRQYEFHYNMALVMAEQLKKAGFKTDLVVVDWATLTQRRNDAKLWDVYFTHSGLFPEPMLSPPQLGDGAPGWWDTPAKKSHARGLQPRATRQARRAVGQGAAGGVRRGAFIEVGKFNGLSARSAKLEGYTPAIWPFFWNTGLAK
jgi:peptide/nickel transport system substrate-binding protein